MNTATQPFCRVDAEAILLKLYAGGWGTPAAGIYTIEPGTKSPAGSQVGVNPGVTRRLQARVFGPVMGGSLKVQWFVNNLLFGETTAASGALVYYDFVEYDPGRSWTITLKVTDQSSQIHATLRNTTLSQTSWTVRVNGLCTDCTFLSRRQHAPNDWSVRVAVDFSSADRQSWRSAEPPCPPRRARAWLPVNEFTTKPVRHWVTS